MIEYTVVSSGKAWALSEEVGDKIKLGWTPIGGVSVSVGSSSSPHQVLFAQAMVRGKEPQNG